MQLNFLKAKIHRATITEADLNYEGSISIDQNLLDESGIVIYEKVDVLNINNGERFTTYVLAEKAGSGVIKVNGAAARKVHKGDLIIIIAYCVIDVLEAKNFQPKIITVNQNNVVDKK